STHSYSLSLHDALPISPSSGDAATGVKARRGAPLVAAGRARGDNMPLGSQTDCGGPRDAQWRKLRCGVAARWYVSWAPWAVGLRSEEHTSELQSRGHLV